MIGDADPKNAARDELFSASTDANGVPAAASGSEQKGGGSKRTKRKA